MFGIPFHQSLVCDKPAKAWTLTHWPTSVPTDSIHIFDYLSPTLRCCVQLWRHCFVIHPPRLWKCALPLSAECMWTMQSGIHCHDRKIILLNGQESSMTFNIQLKVLFKMMSDPKFMGQTKSWRLSSKKRCWNLWHEIKMLKQFQRPAKVIGDFSGWIPKWATICWSIIRMILLEVTQYYHTRVNK